MSLVDLVYFDAGGGHRAAARALAASIAAQRRDWQVRRVNLFDALDPGRRFSRVTGRTPEDLYNARLARGWTLGLRHELRLLQLLIRAAHAPLVRRLVRHWGSTRPDLVVSLIPNFNRALHDSLAAALPGVPCVTVMTDLADLPPHFWIEPGRTRHLVCASERAVAQGLAMGLARESIHRTSGMIIHPDFYAPLALDRAFERSRLGLDPTRPTGVVMFGGQGSMAMLDIAQHLAGRQLVVLCGHNARLADALRRLPATAPRAILGFTADVRRYLALGDFFIGKPGPGCLSEAIELGLPVVTLCNARTLPQERYNADWVRDEGLGVVVARLRDIAPAVDALLPRLPEFAARVRGRQNRAVFEVPEILAGILDGSARPAAARVAPAPSLAHDVREALVTPVSSRAATMEGFATWSPP